MKSLFTIYGLFRQYVGRNWENARFVISVSRDFRFFLMSNAFLFLMFPFRLAIIDFCNVSGRGGSSSHAW